MGQCADCNGHVFDNVHHRCPVGPAPPAGDEAKHDDQALIEAHVEHLVGVELAHRKEIATLQAIVVELRGRLGKAERLLRGWAADAKRRGTGYGDTAAFLELVTSSPPSPGSPVAALPCGCIAHPWGGSCPKPATPPVSTVDSRLAAFDAKLRDVDDRFNHNAAKYNAHLREHDALEARVAALEKLGRGEAGATATDGPADAAAPTQAAPVSPEPHAFVSTPYDLFCAYQFGPQYRERCCKLPDHPIHGARKVR